jgi:uncharacterized protein (TIGR02300 family)
MKAMRGTKRVCPECATRFYDLSRDPIVCPSCGAQHAPAAPAPVAETRAGFTEKAGWRGRRSKQPPEAESAPESEESEPADAEAEDGPDGEAPSPSDDTVLEEDSDDSDISGLLHHHDTEPTER